MYSEKEKNRFRAELVLKYMDLYVQHIFLLFLMSLVACGLFAVVTRRDLWNTWLSGS